VIARVNRQVLQGHRSTVELINASYKKGLKTLLTVPDSRRILELDKRKGRVGISCTNLVASGEGVIICRLDESGLARKQGLLVGTMLLSINGVLCETHQQTIELIDSISPVVRIISRDNVEELELKQDDATWGLTLRDSGGCVGVLVASIYKGGAAAQAGLQVQDVILAIGNEVCEMRARRRRC